MAERILIVEDEQRLNELLQMELKEEGYEVGYALDGRTGLDMALSGEYDLVLLDIMLPGLSGMEVLRRVRKELEYLPIILLTARDTTMDKVGGLDSGADDYVTKPFALEELLARVRAALRKRPLMPTAGGKLSIRGVSLDPDSRRVTVNGQEVKMAKTAFDLLHYLMQNQGKVMNRNDIISAVWGYNYAGETNCVDVYVRSLRKSISETFGIELIETVRGVGYVIR